MDTFGNFPGSVVNNLEVKGDLTVDGSIIGPSIMFEKIYVADGDETGPSYSFVDEKDTGFYRSGPGEISVSGRGVKRLRIGETSSESTGTWAATKFYSSDGSMSAPSVAFTDDTGTGIYSPFIGQLAVSSAGTEKLRVTSTSVTTPVRVEALSSYVSDGTDALPTYSFQDENGTGMYRSAPGEISLSDRGNKILSCNATRLWHNFQIEAGGSVRGSSFVPDSYLMIDSAYAGTQASTIETKTSQLLLVNGVTTATFHATGAQISVPLFATTATITTATVTTLSAPTLTSTTSSIGTTIASTLTLSNQPYLELVRSSNQTIPTNMDTLITFTGVFRQVGTGLNLDVDNGTIVVTSSTNGFYAITAVATWTANSTGYRELYLERNSSYNVGWTGERAPSSDLLTRTVTATTYMLTSGSYIRFRCEQSSGGDLDLQNVRLYIGRVW